MKLFAALALFVIALSVGNGGTVQVTTFRRLPVGCVELSWSYDLRSWQPMGTTILTTNTTAWLIVEHTNSPMKFYRVRKIECRTKN